MEKDTQKKKLFYIIATPIGNLEDITLRALRIMSELDVLLCEDTRTTKKILKAYDISVTTESYHSQSSENKENSIITRIQSGTLFGLVSDAGTPTLSDPGVKLIARIRELCPDVQLISIPGASACIAGLSTTGFTGNQFTFYGFLPHKKGRTKIFDEINSSSRVSVFYESPHRLMKTLKELSLRFGHDRKVSVARELTKIHEETPVKTARDMYHYFLDNPEKVRGECVIIIDK